MRLDKIKRYAYISFAIFLAIALSIIFFFLLFRLNEFGAGLKKVIGILMPFIYGAVIAYLLCPMCNFFEKYIKKIVGSRFNGKRSFSVIRLTSALLSLIVACFIIYILLLMIIPQIVSSITGLIELVPTSTKNFMSWIEGVLADNQSLLNIVDQSVEKISSYMDNWITTGLIPSMQTLASGFSTGVVSILVVLKNLLIGIIVAVYLLLSRDKFARQSDLVLFSVFKEKWANMIRAEVLFADKMFSGFIYGKLVDSAIIGVLCFCGMSIFRMPYAVLISVIVGVTNIIPFFGPYIGAVPSAFIILMVSPVKCIYFILFILVLQQFDGNILGPKILGNTTGLSSFWVLFSILLFGGLYGFVGMIIGVPLFAIIYDIIKKLVLKGLNRRSKEGMLAEYEKDFPSD